MRTVTKYIIEKDALRVIEHFSFKLQIMLLIFNFFFAPNAIILIRLLSFDFCYLILVLAHGMKYDPVTNTKENYLILIRNIFSVHLF